MENNYDEDMNDYMIGCDPEDAQEYDYEDDRIDWSETMSDVEADADTLKSAGMGTDEDYNGYMIGCDDPSEAGNYADYGEDY